ncbi:hypothetical protein [Bradyrhizobium nanningense]|uniref:hypothetical protein n=1 Tax=Bradyrhizobium nanningense TaxID=1325118 RepID=UPI0019D6F7EF|nr:hypothetical protein [Bradyrhizobium nanningense]
MTFFPFGTIAYDKTNLLFERDCHVISLALRNASSISVRGVFRVFFMNARTVGENRAGQRDDRKDRIAAEAQDDLQDKAFHPRFDGGAPQITPCHMSRCSDASWRRRHGPGFP